MNYKQTFVILQNEQVWWEKLSAIQATKDKAPEMPSIIGVLGRVIAFFVE